MYTNTRTAVAHVGNTDLRRRALLGMAAAIASVPLIGRAWGETTLADPTATITRLNGSLLAAMKSASQSNFHQRFEALAPAIERAFDLPTVLAVSVGLGWPSLSPDQQGRLLDAFRRYTIASYVANFDSYNGQSFSVAPETTRLDADRVIVKSRIAPVSGDATELDYVMQQTPAGWKIVDVLAAGSISRVAVQRSDFRHLLSRGGGDALLASLQRKASDLSGGALA